MEALSLGADDGLIDYEKVPKELQGWYFSNFTDLLSSAVPKVTAAKS